MRESPRLRRLRSDLRALEKLRSESSIVEFSVPSCGNAQSPESYQVRFRGRGVWRSGDDQILIRTEHEVSIQLGAGYPRMMPELSWRTPIFHPNISTGGVVCLGGYGAHWVPSLQLDALCTMLWDMIRYRNYDVESPYNREAALWAKSQTQYRFPLDARPIRDRLAGLDPPSQPRTPPVIAPPVIATPTTPVEEMVFLDGPEIVEAELVEGEDPDILFIE